ncbi:MAG: methylated-DNA--[protein]-cysteine S-methyltransferase [Defluviitaleaceae bacterium]|nr:methylated-DNA--[protein]-cysteine S-methyltransferase [Defluviitaleaceae bacterium]
MRRLIDSPIGSITLIAEEGAITGLYFGDTNQNIPLGNDTALDLCEKELADYFAGDLQVFSVPINAKGTPFRQQVWEALLEIPYGKTASYSDIAVRIENPKSVRAVGGANHNNPISIIIPCHRVIGANGSLTGYGGGLESKKWLLNLEEKYKDK